MFDPPAPASDVARPPSSRFVWLLFGLATLLNAFLLWHFHTRYWYPTDDGFYAHIARRLAAGEVLNRDIQDLHPGYIHFLHAAAFRLFGLDLVSLRYPMVLASVLQGCAVFLLLVRRSPALAAIGSVASTAVGTIQFFSPGPNWYCLSLAVALAWWMTAVDARRPMHFFGTGILLGVLTMFRQLSGVWIAMGVLVVALWERSSEGRGPDLLLARALLLIMAAALLGYLALTPETEPGGVLLIAIWPVAVLTWTFLRIRTTNRDVAKLVAELGAGVALPVLPLLFYHVAHGSVAIWLHDISLAGARETQMDFYGHGWYGVLPIAGLYQALTSLDVAKVINGVYWAVLPLLWAVNGLVVLRNLRTGVSAQPALPLLAAFYALVSLLFEGPLYLYYSVGFTLVAVLWAVATASPRIRAACGAAAASVAVVAIVFHAGQSRLRTPLEVLEGARVSNIWGAKTGGLGRCSLNLEPSDRDTYGRLVRLIQSETAPDAAILALPNDAELYFLADRRNPTRFYNSALGVQTEGELADLMERLAADPPVLVLFRPTDKYNNFASTQVMDFVRKRYDHIDTVNGLDVYRLADSHDTI
jgi:hypothetical protein